MTDHLSGVDAAWLHMEEPTNPMVVNALLELGGRLERERLVAVVEKLSDAAPRFRSRVVEPLLHVGTPHWEPVPGFQPSDQLREVKLTGSEAALRHYVGKVTSAVLPRDRALWEVHVIDRGTKGTAALCRVHHAIADGFALLAVLLSLCDEEVKVPPAPTTRGWRPGSLLRQAASLTRLVTLGHDVPGQLKRPLSGEKRVAWSAPVPLERVKALAHRHGATVNDVLIGALAGALRRQVDGTHDLRAMVPVNLRFEKVDTRHLGNRFGLVILSLPVGTEGPLERLKETSRRMARLKSSPEALVAHGLLAVMGWAPVQVEDLGVAFFAKKSSLVLTNVPGPREPLHLAGRPLKRLLFWVPQSGRMGLGVSIFSYAGEVTLGVMADAAVLPAPEALVEALEAELDALEPKAEKPRSRRRAPAARRTRASR